MEQDAKATGFEPVFPRRPAARPRRRRWPVILLIIALLAGISLYWWWQARPATLAAGRAAGIIIAQSLRACGGSFPVWLTADSLLVTMDQNNRSALFTVTLNEAPRPFIPFTPVSQWQYKAHFPVPDCRQAAVCRGLVAFTGNSDIWLRAEDASLRRLTAADGLAGQPSFTPDGKRVYYTVSRRDRLAIWSVDADGQDAAVFLQDDNADFAAPAVSPDGNWLALVSSRGGSPDLWLARLPDGQLTRLTSSPAVETTPAWSPDSSMLVYAAGNESNTDLWVANADGSQPNQITKTAVSEYAPAWSPDGTRLAAQVGSGPDAAVWVYTFGYNSYSAPR